MQCHANSSLTSEDNTLPPIATHGYGSPTLPGQFLPAQTLQSDSVPSSSLPFVASTWVYSRPIVSVRVPASSSTDAIPVMPTRSPLATSRVSSFLDRPAMFSEASDIVNPSFGRNVYGFQPLATSHYPASKFSTAGQDSMCTTASTGPANVVCPPLCPFAFK